ncbi:SACE_7040 family transcriptional regulator [Streptomyces tsukubensis]|uniref:TetR family transcriptional regulator n=1 Tax=Streptomyces tsukubensis TaxID=83656 RepID=A0A1V4A0U4_9ACTN|nr:TetR/AcrR family transcriptional regulator [Streptomyces tsukubensis]OON72544.1 TetR family transcriptional regulator [Streptomyces tsukubensis]QFR93668.1 TetR family transcriptional regulator [Streptomyces tsukubensis]
MSTGSAKAAPTARTREEALTRREQILQQAARLFAERGFHGVGVDEIGAAVGISGPGLYRHFAGKDAMLAELLVGISQRLLSGGKRRVKEAEGPPRRLLDSLIEGHIDFALDDRSLIVLHDRELDRLRESDRKLVRQLQRQYVELWVEAVRKVAPALAEAQARATVHAVFGLLNSTPHQSAVDATGREAMAELLHRLARGAFRAAGETAGGTAGEAVEGTAGEAVGEAGRA